MKPSPVPGFRKKNIPLVLIMICKGTEEKPFPCIFIAKKGHSLIKLVRYIENPFSFQVEDVRNVDEGIKKVDSEFGGLTVKWTPFFEPDKDWIDRFSLIF